MTFSSRPEKDSPAKDESQKDTPQRDTSRRNTLHRAAGKRRREKSAGGKRWRRFRLAAASLMFFLFLFSSLSSTGAAEKVSLFLSKIQLIPAIIRISTLARGLSEPGVIPAVLAGVLVLMLISAAAFFTGRIYCAFFCPLGLLQDAVIEPSVAGAKKRGKRRRRKPFRFVALPARSGNPGYWILAITLLAALSGTMIPLNLLEPYAFWGRITSDLFYPVKLLFNRAAFEASKLQGKYIPLLDFDFNLPVFAVTLSAALLLLFFTLKKGRIFCSIICPAGTLLGIFSKRSAYTLSIDSRACTGCGLCEKNCRTGCIDSANRVLDFSRCVLCGDCLAVCPEGAVAYSRSNPAGRGERSGAGRRYFLSRLSFFASSSAAFFFFPQLLYFRRRSHTPSGEKNTPSLPAGAVSIRHFTSRCISCHRCVSVCPTGVLKPSLFEYGFRGILQPVMDFKSGFCEYDCIKCGRACPAGAILPVNFEKKKTTQTGRVYFESERCVVVTNGTACGACAESCPTHAVGLEPCGGGLDIPVTDNEICIGCGSCEHICPVPDKAIYVKGLSVHGRAEAREPLYSKPVDTSGEGFPF